MVASRRAVLRTAGALCLAALPARLVWGQTFTATSISQAAQEARRDVGRLARRADTLLRQTIADGPERSGAALRRFRAEQAALSRDLAEIFNKRVSEDDWLLVVPTRELDLVLTMQPQFIRIAPSEAEVEAAIKEPLPQIEPQAGDQADDIVLAIVLAALGARTRDKILATKLREDAALAGALKSATLAVKAKRYGLAAFELERLMRATMQTHNAAVISDRLGHESRFPLYRKLVVRFVPFVGWSIFVALLLAAIYQNRETVALLR